MNTDTVMRAEPELEPHHAEVIRATLPLVSANIDRIAELFYKTMFAAHPELLTDLFNRGNQAQGAQQRAQAAAVATFATHLVDPELPHPAIMMSRIAHKHASLGVTPAQYQIVHDNLFAAIIEVLGGDVVEPPIAAAWDRVYWLMAEALITEEKELYDAANVASGDVFRDARVLARTEDPAGAAIFTVESADPTVKFPGFIPGQYISVGVRLPDGARQLRQYSMIGLPGDGTLSFAVKRIDAAEGCPAGEVSNWLHQNLRPGDTVQITLPFGDVAIDPTATTPLMLISGGIGVTPTIGMLEYLAAHAPGREVLIVHADRGTQTHPLLDRMHELAARLERATVEIWYEEPALGARSGRVDLSELTLPADADAYVCGPPAFMHAVQSQLRDAGVPDDRVHIELFTPTDVRVDEGMAR
ncbi:globin domain-containing protein [Nocardia sp. 004]|uniref:globin domain-containing protein n=1 Tax=Nocardia sp. 004 TaxID=3385978 RepID=UPI00399F2AEC